MNLSKELILKFEELIQSHDPKLLAWLFQKAIAHDNLDQCIFDIGLDLTIEIIAELGLRELILLKPSNVTLQDLWFQLESSHLLAAA